MTHEVELYWKHPGPDVERARVLLAAALDGFGGATGWSERVTGQESTHLALHVNGRRVLTLLHADLSPARVAERISRSPRPLIPLSWRLLPALLYLAVPKCGMCWAAYFASLGAVASWVARAQEWMAVSLAVLLAALVAMPARRAMRESRWITVAAIAAGWALVAGSRFSSQRWWLAAAGAILLVGVCRKEPRDARA